MPTADSPAAGSTRLEDFNKYFEISLATTRKQREQVYRVRYRVYCEEFGYEPLEESGNHQEMDEFDCQSMHCLVTHRETGVAAGCVRVVVVEGNDKMPMEILVPDSIDKHFIDSFADRRDTVCEISRLAVDGGFRRRRHERESRFGNIDSNGFDESERRSYPLIALALIVGAGAVADILNRKNCFAIMEPFLPAMLQRGGMPFRRIGTDFEFRGTRAPYYGNMDELIAHAPPERRLHFDLLRAYFAAQLLPKRVAP